MNPLNSIRRGASAVNTAQSGEPQKKSTANNIPLRTLSPTGTRPAPPRPARALTAPGPIRHQLQLAGIFRQRAALALTERDKRVRLVFALAVPAFPRPGFSGLSFRGGGPRHPCQRGTLGRPLGRKEAPPPPPLRVTDAGWQERGGIN